MKWHTATNYGHGQQSFAELQTDGNFVIIHSSTSQILWSSNSSNVTSNGPYQLILNDDGYLYILNKNNEQIWKNSNNHNSPPIILLSIGSDTFNLNDSLSDDDISLLIMFGLC